MNYGNIIVEDYVNGLGIRVSLFVSGCRNYCPGCFSPKTWDFNYGTHYSRKTEDSIIEELRKEYYDGLTILGGDPMEIENQIAVSSLVKRVKREFGETRNIWLYSGYYYEDFMPNGKRYLLEHTDAIMDNIDVLVDGPFEEDKKDLTLEFRGSSNQRIIDVKKSKEDGEVILYKEAYSE